MSTVLNKIVWVTLPNSSMTRTSHHFKELHVLAVTTYFPARCYGPHVQPPHRIPHRSPHSSATSKADTATCSILPRDSQSRVHKELWPLLLKTKMKFPFLTCQNLQEIPQLKRRLRKTTPSLLNHRRLSHCHRFELSVSPPPFSLHSFQANF